MSHLSAGVWMNRSSNSSGGATGPTGVGLSANPSPGRADHANRLHHAGSPWFLALTALGVVYGDIGTSPLYAFQVALTGIGHPVPTAADVLGIVSLIFWV